MHYCILFTIALVPPISTMNIWRGIMYSINLMGPFNREIQSPVTAADPCDGGISVLNHCLSWSKFVNTHLSHSSPDRGLIHTQNNHKLVVSLYIPLPLE